VKSAGINPSNPCVRTRQVQWVRVGVFGDSRSGKEDRCECRRSLRTERQQRRLREVRATIRAEKWVNAHGAKGGRKANIGRP
jgi:hypothetical protein